MLGAYGITDQSNDFLASAEEVSATLFDAIQTSKVPKVVALSSVGSEHPTGTVRVSTYVKCS